MSNVKRLLTEVPIPRMVDIRQSFDQEKLDDISGCFLKELDRNDIIHQIYPGMTIAITAGSRGIANLAEIIKVLVNFLQNLGACPFVVAAMGSHGGSSAEGQKAILSEFGITETYLGCPVVSTKNVKQIGVLDDGRAIFINRLAAEADGIIPLNRIKAHTAFCGRFESGVMKMMTIGLGNQKGAETCHRQGIPRLGENVEKFAFGILSHARILFGVGIVENAFDQTLKIKVMSKEEIPRIEPKLLALAKSKMAHIFFDSVNVLIVDQIGKNISGEGMDPNITGRFIVPGIEGGISADRIGVLSLTKESLGNFVGLGMADVCSKGAFDRCDFDITYPNSLTSTVTCLCRIPMVFTNHQLTIQAAIKMVPDCDPSHITMIRIHDTLSLHAIQISENLLPLAKKNPKIEIMSDPKELVFNTNGNLFEDE
jgi:hypothetical protein